MPLSTIPYYEPIACIYATIFVGFGILYLVNIPKALSFFEITYPDIKTADKATPADNTDSPYRKELLAAKHTIDTMSIVYGVRDMYMGAAIYAAAACGTRMTLGWILMAAASVAAADGGACWWMNVRGKKGKVGLGDGGVWNHWSYAPVLLVLGLVGVGGLDWVY